jgi:hypothetical protein
VAGAVAARCGVRRFAGEEALKEGEHSGVLLLLRKD